MKGRSMKSSMCSSLNSKRSFEEKNCHAFSSPLEDEKRREEKKKITLSFTKEIWVKWKRLLLFPIIEECKGGCKPFLSL